MERHVGKMYPLMPECAHPISDREMTRLRHGAAQLWCSFCAVWRDVNAEAVGEQTTLFDQDWTGSYEGEHEW